MPAPQDCPPNTTDCLPAGSNAADPCSPCFEPTCENFLSVVAELSRQVCATGNMIKGWNQRLDKFRNRMDRLEDELNNLPGAEDSVDSGPCQNADADADGVDSLLGCNEGRPTIISATGEEESDEFEVVACDGKWHRQKRGLTFHGMTPVPFALSNGANAITLPDFPTDVCGDIYAVFQTSASIAEGPSGAPTSLTTTISPYTLVIAGTYRALGYAEARAKVTSSATTVTVAISGSPGNYGVSTKLIGYYY